MKSNRCILPQNTSQLTDVFAEVEKCAAFNQLSRKHALQLRLLAEELTGMLPALLKWSQGVFWLENDGLHYELHVALTAFIGSIDQHDKLLALSTSGKNAAAVGIMGKLRCAIEEAMLVKLSSGSVMSTSNSIDLPSGEWSLTEYRRQVQDQNDKIHWDELERSIIANLADDVSVAIRSDQVEIVVAKTFWM